MITSKKWLLLCISLKRLQSGWQICRDQKGFPSLLELTVSIFIWPYQTCIGTIPLSCTISLICADKRLDTCSIQLKNWHFLKSPSSRLFKDRVFNEILIVGQLGHASACISLCFKKVNLVLFARLPRWNCYCRLIKLRSGYDPTDLWEAKWQFPSRWSQVK